MSARYLNSPALHLTVGNSRLRRILHGLLCLCAAVSLYRLYLRGYPLLAGSLLPLACLCCVQLAKQSLCGATVCWRQGEWSVLRDNVSYPVSVGRRSACLPGFIYLACEEQSGGRCLRLWLFPDSAPAEQLRRLRVRLVFER